MVATTTKQCRTLLVGITGSAMILDIAAYLSRLKEEFTEELECLVSEAAQGIVSPTWLAATVASRMYTEWIEPDGAAPHIAATRRADLFVVLPATANSICKCAAGIADTSVTAAVSASLSPVVFAPAMNEAAWESGPVRRAVRLLRDDGHYVIEPESFRSATEQREGRGRAVSQERLLSRLRHLLAVRQAANYLPTAVGRPAQTPSTNSSPPPTAPRLQRSSR